VAAIALVSASALACSGSSSTPSNSGNGGTVQIPGGAGKAFVPEGIVYEQMSAPGGDPSGFKLVAATLRDYGNLQELFMTVQNMGTQFGCQSAVATEVDDAAMNMLGGGSLLVNGQMYQITGGVTVCLGPGEVGIGSYPVLSDPLPTAVDRIRYEFTPGLYPSGTKLVDVVPEGLTVANATGPVATVSGHLINHGAAAVQNVVVNLFAIDGATLRPYAKALAGVDSIAPGAQWDFTMHVDGPVADYRTFVNYAQP